jgi:hypothetical protein
VLGPGEEKTDEEVYVGQEVKAAAPVVDGAGGIDDLADDTPPEIVAQKSSNYALKKMYAHYLTLLNEHDVNYW